MSFKVSISVFLYFIGANNLTVTQASDYSALKSLSLGLHFVYIAYILFVLIKLYFLLFLVVTLFYGHKIQENI